MTNFNFDPNNFAAAYLQMVGIDETECVTEKDRIEEALKTYLSAMSVSTEYVQQFLVNDDSN